ncbi:MAG: hypothetical protein KC535_02360 [Nanoarchaeota archaeon]|nr:hypothetical protein [Nanoarchaeota archaeon]
MSEKRQGQISTEFLFTYGISFMVILMVIGGLSYFGVLNVSTFVPVSCDLGNSLFCPIFSLDHNGTVFHANLQIANNGDTRVTLTNMSIKDASLDAYCFASDITDTSGVSLVAAQKTLTNHQDEDFVFVFEDGLSGCNFTDSFVDVTSKRKFDVRLYYLSADATQETSTKGSIIAPAK